MSGHRCKQLYYAWGTFELWQLYPYLHNDQTDGDLHAQADGDLHNDQSSFDIEINR